MPGRFDPRLNTDRLVGRVADGSWWCRAHDGFHDAFARMLAADGEPAWAEVRAAMAQHQQMRDYVAAGVEKAVHAMAHADWCLHRDPGDRRAMWSLIGLDIAAEVDVLRDIWRRLYALGDFELAWVVEYERHVQQTRGVDTVPLLVGELRTDGLVTPGREVLLAMLSASADDGDRAWLGRVLAAL